MATASKVPSAKLGARAGFKAQGNQANQAYEELRDATNDGADIIESLCMQCEEQGETRLLLTKIPFFKVCVSSLIHPSHENIVPLSLSLSPIFKVRCSLMHATLCCRKIFSCTLLSPGSYDIVISLQPLRFL